MTTLDAKIIVLDDDAGVRKALARLLRSAGLKVITFASAREFLDQLPSVEADCIVLDIRMPGLSGLDLQAELNARNIETPVIFITGYGDVPTTVKAMKGGALDFLPKPFKDKDLLEAIGEAIRKGQHQKTAREEKAEIRRLAESLTPREHEVFGLVVKGLLNKQIAAELGTSEKTIKVHRSRVMQKMKVKSVADLVRAAERVKAEHS